MMERSTKKQGSVRFARFLNAELKAQSIGASAFMSECRISHTAFYEIKKGRVITA